MLEAGGARLTTFHGPTSGASLPEIMAAPCCGRDLVKAVHQASSAAEHSSIVSAEILICKPVSATPCSGVGRATILQLRSIMSTAGAVLVGGRAWPLKPPGALRLELRDKFYRFFRKLPDGFEDVDPEVLRRVPAPI